MCGDHRITGPCEVSDFFFSYTHTNTFSKYMLSWFAAQSSVRGVVCIFRKFRVIWLRSAVIAGYARSQFDFKRSKVKTCLFDNNMRWQNYIYLWVYYTHCSKIKKNILKFASCGVYIVYRGRPTNIAPNIPKHISRFHTRRILAHKSNLKFRSGVASLHFLLAHKTKTHTSQTAPNTIIIATKNRTRAASKSNAQTSLNQLLMCIYYIHIYK